MKKNKTLVSSLTIPVVIAGGCLLFFLLDLSDTEVSLSDQELDAPSLEAKLLNEEKVHDERSIEVLKDPLASLGTKHVHGPNCNHGVAVPGADIIAKPLNHDVLPQMFESALAAYGSSTGKKKHFPIYADVFSQLKASKVGDETMIELNQGLVLKGTVKSLKSYPSDPTVFSGMVELADYDAKLSFFDSASGITARILFNEKSKALVFEESPDGPIFVESQISEMFCSGKGAVYPLSHPSNAGTGHL